MMRSIKPAVLLIASSLLSCTASVPGPPEDPLAEVTRVSTNRVRAGKVETRIVDVSRPSGGDVTVVYRIDRSSPGILALITPLALTPLYWDDAGNAITPSDPAKHVFRVGVSPDFTTQQIDFQKWTLGPMSIPRSTASISIALGGTGIESVRAKIP